MIIHLANVRLCDGPNEGIDKFSLDGDFGIDGSHGADIVRGIGAKTAKPVDRDNTLITLTFQVVRERSSNAAAVRGIVSHFASVIYAGTLTMNQDGGLVTLADAVLTGFKFSTLGRLEKYSYTIIAGAMS